MVVLIAGGRGQRRVSEKNLNHPHIGVGFQKVGGKAVPQGVQRRGLGDPGQSYEITHLQSQPTRPVQPPPSDSHHAGRIAPVTMNACVWTQHASEGEVVARAVSADVTSRIVSKVAKSS